MINNKGFTLVEVLVSLVVISMIMIITSSLVTSTLAVSENEAYKLFKNNIVSVSYDYVNECTAGMIDCDFDFLDNNSFKAEVLKNYGYFEDLNSPIDGKDLGQCLILSAVKENGVVLVELKDNCY